MNRRALSAAVSAFGSWLRAAAARIGISFSSPPTPIAAMSSPADRHAADQPLQHPVGPVQRRAMRAQPGRPITGRLRPDCPRNSRLPGSTGIPNRATLPPAARSACGADVVRVRRGRAGQDQDQVAPAAAPGRRPWRPSHAARSPRRLPAACQARDSRGCDRPAALGRSASSPGRVGLRSAPARAHGPDGPDRSAPCPPRAGRAHVAPRPRP